MKEMKYLPDFRAVVSRSEERGSVQGPRVLSTRLHLWCCSSAAAFEALREAARSVLLASGTLAPLEAFASELGLAFDVRLETAHVIDAANQLWARVLSSDPSGAVCFNWAYKNTDNVRLQGSRRTMCCCFFVLSTLSCRRPRTKCS